MLTIFIAAFFLGFIFNAAPGPVFAESLRQGVYGGYRAALLVQIGSLLGDASWAILGLLGVGLLLQLDILRIPLGVLGIVYLCYLAWDSWQSADQEFHLNHERHQPNALRSGALLSLTNPQNIAYWAAIGSALGSLGVQHPTAGDYGIYFAGFMCSSILWCFIGAFIVELMVVKLRQGWTAVTFKVCALAFVLLALSSLKELIVELRSTSGAQSSEAKHFHL